MTDDNRSADRNDLDAMTREFLEKGGKILQCAPGSSDNVVYRKGTFRRRPANYGKTDGAVAGAMPPAAMPPTAPPPQAMAAGSDGAAD